MNTVKIVRGDLGIREIKGVDKMAFSLDSLLKRQIVFKPKASLGIREIKGVDKMAFSLDSLLKRQIVFKPI